MKNKNHFIATIATLLLTIMSINVSAQPHLAVTNKVDVVISSDNKTENETATVYLLDNTGKELFSKQQTTATPSAIDLNNYAPGIYYIKVAIGKEQLYYRVVKPK